MGRVASAGECVGATLEFRARQGFRIESRSSNFLDLRPCAWENVTPAKEACYETISSSTQNVEGYLDRSLQHDDRRQRNFRLTGFLSVTRERFAN